MFAAVDVPGPNITVTDIGTWVVGLGVFLVILERVKALLWPSKPKGEQVVSQAELGELRASLNLQIAELRAQLSGYVTRIEFQRLEESLQELVSDYKELCRQSQSRYDAMTQNMHNIGVRVEAIRGDIRGDMEHLIDLLKDRK